MYIIDRCCGKYIIVRTAQPVFNAYFTYDKDGIDENELGLSWHTKDDEAFLFYDIIFQTDIGQKDMDAVMEHAYYEAKKLIAE